MCTPRNHETASESRNFVVSLVEGKGQSGNTKDPDTDTGGNGPTSEPQIKRMGTPSTPVFVSVRYKVSRGECPGGTRDESWSIKVVSHWSDSLSGSIS